MCRLVPAANSASYISFMADAHWAASARMPSNLLLAEAVTAAQEAGRHGDHPDALQWVDVLQHLRHCCQAYRQGLIPLLPPSPPPPPPLLLLFPSSSSDPLLPLLSLLSLFLFLFIAPATFTFSNSTICRQLQVSQALYPPPPHEAASQKEVVSSTNPFEHVLAGQDRS